MASLLAEEVGQDLCACIVAVGAYAVLRINAQELRADLLAVDGQILHRVAEQRAACRLQVLAADLCAAVACQILTGDPLSRKADLVNADVLVRDQDVAGVRLSTIWCSSRLACFTRLPVANGQ